MSIIIDDLYPELINNLGLIEQLKFRCTNKFHPNKINSDLLKEFIHFKTNHSDEEIYFFNVCEFGYINLAKWLHQLGADIHAEDEQAFQLTCENGHIEVRGSTIPEQTLAGSR